jgi:4-hydroxy-tetrahydrodipicolinate reductase
MALKIFLNGSSGRLNQTLIRVAPEVGAEICTGGVNPRTNPDPGIAACDAVIDFSFHTATLPLIERAAKHSKPIVIATTGHTPEEREAILAWQTKIPMVWSGNYAFGVNVFFHLVREAARLLGPEFNAEIVELHRAGKKDSPGGTAEQLSRIICEEQGWNAQESVTYGRKGIQQNRPEAEVCIHALRLGEVVGEHITYFASPFERLEIIQRSQDKSTFARGAFKAAEWVLNKPAGLYTMENVLGISSTLKTL